MFQSISKLKLYFCFWQECHVQPLSASKQVHLVILYLSASFSQRFSNPVLRASVTTATSILWDFSILLKILVPPAPPFSLRNFQAFPKVSVTSVTPEIFSILFKMLVSPVPPLFIQKLSKSVWKLVSPAPPLFILEFSKSVQNLVSSVPPAPPLFNRKYQSLSKS